MAKAGSAKTTADFARSQTPGRPSADLLEGKTLEAILTELVECYGWALLAGEVAIRCFQHEPSIKSSLKFLRRTPWARSKVEKVYLRHVARKALQGGADPLQ
jgi:uncharacterized protein (DUF2132 family)